MVQYSRSFYIFYVLRIGLLNERITISITDELEARGREPQVKASGVGPSEFAWAMIFLNYQLGIER